jgi:hypothetical protein
MEHDTRPGTGRAVLATRRQAQSLILPASPPLFWMGTRHAEADVA